MSVLRSRRYESRSAYQIQDADIDAIVRVASYHRKEFARSVIWFPPREHAIVLSSISTPFPRTFSGGLGSLGRLPLELWQDVILRLDIYSLIRLRQTNGYVRQIVDSTNQYQLVVVHGLNLLCALLRTQLAIRITLHDCYQTLCTKHCTFCGEFAGFVSLLTWERCCHICVQDRKEIQVQTRAAVQKRLHLTTLQLKKLRSFKSLPGIYSMDETKYRSKVMLVSVHEAISAFRQPPGAAEQAIFVDSTRARKFNFMASCALPYYHKGTGKVEHGVSCAGCQYAFENDIMEFRREGWAAKARDREYAKDGFLAHFQWCEQAQLLWLSSKNGTVRPAGLPEAARRRGFFNEGA